MCLGLFAALAAVCVQAQTVSQSLSPEIQLQSENTMVRLNVSANADPGGDGSADRPFARLTDAVNVAVRYKQLGQSVLVLVGDGVYREGPIEFGYTNFNGNQPDNSSAIEVRAVNAGAAIVSGADVWTDWERATDGEYSHAWEYDWGVSENPWSGDVAVEEIVLRREMVIVDGAMQRQVLSRTELVPGSFYVDEAQNRLWLKPMPGVDPANAIVEVGIRPVLWDQNHEDNVTLRGLTFQHAVTEWAVARAAVRISASDNVVIEDARFEWSNWTGLYVGESNGVQIDDVVMNNNGGQGWAMFRVNDVEIRNSATSFNNWRGGWGGFTGWSIGNKILSARKLRIYDHRAIGNESRGLWLDYDISDAVVSGAVLNENHRDGIWIEASQGPITIRKSVMRDNHEAGLHSTFSHNVVIDSNEFAGNREAQIKLGGTSTRVVRDFVSGEDMHLRASGWVITNNAFEGVALATNHMKPADWRAFVNSLVSDQNRFTKPTFRVLRRRFQLDGWRQLTGQDENSSASPSGAP